MEILSFTFYKTTCFYECLKKIKIFGKQNGF